MNPKLFIMSADGDEKVDGTITKQLLDFLPNKASCMGEADAIVVPVSYLSPFKFNPALNDIRKPVVILDLVEYGWDAGEKENRFGFGQTQRFGHLATPEYALLDDWVRDHPPALTFKRELQKVHQSKSMLPVEWPCQTPALPLQDKEKFDARPIEVFNCWGLSNPSRPRLHGDIFRNAHDFGIHVVDNWNQDGHFEKRTWATIHAPWYRRTHPNEVLKWNRRAKISVSLPGAGVKCFRSTMESPVGSITALQHDSLAWAYDWVDGLNCIRLKPGKEFESLECATHRDNLWDIYRNCQETVEKYRSRNYIDNYVIPSISSIL